MQALSTTTTVQTDGHGHCVDLTDDLVAWLQAIGATNGQLTVFVPGSTAAVTTIEFEPGALQDLGEALEEIAPSTRGYHHDRRWGDGNGFSHLRAALLGPSLTIPVVGGTMQLGTWQQATLVECDLHARPRKLLFSFVGSCAEGGSPCRT